MTFAYLSQRFRPLSALALTLALPLASGCTVKITDFQGTDSSTDSDTDSGTESSTESGTGDTPNTTTGAPTGSSGDSDSEGSTSGSGGPMTTTANPTTADPTTSDTDMTSSGSDTSATPCEEHGTEDECLVDQECIWAAVKTWQEGDLCPELAGEGSCFSGQYVGDGCQFFEGCDPGRVYNREVAPGEFEVFTGNICGVEPLGDWKLCDPEDLQGACGCFCGG